MISYRTNVTVSAITLLIYAVATIIGISMLIEHAELEDYKVVIWPWCFTKIIWVGVGLVFVAYTMGYNVLFTLNLIEGVFAIGFIYRIWKDKWPRCLC